MDAEALDGGTYIAGRESFQGFMALGLFVGALFAGCDLEGEDAVTVDFHRSAP